MKKSKVLIVLLSMVLCGCSSSKSLSESTTAFEPTTALVAETSASSAAETTTSPTAEASTESIIETTATADTANTDTTISDEQSAALDFTKEVSKAIEGDIGEGEEVTDMAYSFKDKNLSINVSLQEEANSYGLSHQDIALSRAGAITDSILDLTDHYNMWESITVDFGVWGYSKNSKADIVGGDMPYFENIQIQTR